MLLMVFLLFHLDREEILLVYANIFAWRYALMTQLVHLSEN